MIIGRSDRYHTRMRPISSCWALVLVLGCGGDDSDMASEPLGQICGLNDEACSPEAPRCLVTEGSSSLTGFCSATCVDSGTFMTDAQANPQNVTPPLRSGDAVCQALYSGSIGTAACIATFDVMPPLPLQANTAYTFRAGCVIQCGAANECPEGLTCNSRHFCEAP